MKLKKNTQIRILIIIKFDIKFNYYIKFIGQKGTRTPEIRKDLNSLANYRNNHSATCHRPEWDSNHTRNFADTNTTNYVIRPKIYS